MKNNPQNPVMVILGVATLVVFAAFIAVSFHAVQLKRSFRNEMAQRLDVEEKLIRVDQQREALISQLKKLQSEMDKTKSTMTKLQSDLGEAKSEDAAETMSQEGEKK